MARSYRVGDEVIYRLRNGVSGKSYGPLEKGTIIKIAPSEKSWLNGEKMYTVRRPSFVDIELHRNEIKRRVTS